MIQSTTHKKQYNEKILTLFACAALLGTACTDDANDDGKRHRTYAVAVQLVYPEGSELTATEGSRSG